MNRIADRGLRIADSEMQAEAPLHPAVNGLSPSIRPVASRNPQSPIRNPQSVELHIEELVLHGFAPGDRHRIADAVERELARSFAEQGLPPSLTNGIEIARLDGGVFQVARGSKAEAVGSQVGQAVYGGLS